jgi:hypothetical protein
MYTVGDVQEALKADLITKERAEVLAEKLFDLSIQLSEAAVELEKRKKFIHSG